MRTLSGARMPHARSAQPSRALRRPLAVCASAVPAAAVSVKTDGLVFARGAPGSWDEAAVGSPVVRCYMGDDEQRWYMWYSGRAAAAPAVDLVATSSGRIGLATSADGVNWNRGSEQIEGARGAAAAADVGSVIAPNGDWWTFDTCHLAPSDIQVLSNSSVSSGVGVYWMFYSGGDFEPVPIPEGFPGATAGVEPATLEGFRMRPGLAMSQDGRNWARIEADHHTGALFDVGKVPEFDQLFIASPQLLNVAPRDMRLYYTTWDVARKRYVVGMAASPDGFRWTKKGVVYDAAGAEQAAVQGGGAAAAGTAVFDALGPAAISVVRDFDNRQFLMFYEAVAADNSRSIGMAVSKDGFKWARCPQAVLQPSSDAGGWDQGAVGAPCAASMSAGRWRLYYGGRSGQGAGAWEGIGLALSAEGGPTCQNVPISFKRRATTQ